MLAVICDALLVEKIGRRRMTLFGFTGACVGILLMGIIGTQDYKNARLGAVLVVSGVIANFCNTFQASVALQQESSCRDLTPFTST
jgi:SP family general alpha glucoside:H+ symporter-like MFS transporter